MKKISFLFFLCIALNVYAQEEIQFNKTKSWAETIQAAEDSGKLIFVDCYTDWCAPCRWMDQNVFNAAPITDFYNKNFINVKIDMEKGEGIELGKKYNVRSFPTFLFINSKGEIVHRTGSRMDIQEFLKEGQNASDPKGNSNYLAQKYQEGADDLPFLVEYYTALSRTDRSQSDKVAKEIIEKITEDQLNTELGWQVIKTLSRNEYDKLGAHFMANQVAYEKWSTQEERNKLKDRLITYSIYGLIRDKDEKAFRDKLAYFKNSDDLDHRKEAIMLEAEFYLSTDRNEEYIKLTSAAMKNELKEDADKLSFLARRSIGGRGGMELGPVALQNQAYEMAKRAVELKPEEYSIQSTYAQVCLILKKKEEGLKAANKTVNLANPLGSKIIRLAQGLLDEIEAL